jgi:hypothetical protein
LREDMAVDNYFLTEIALSSNINTVMQNVLAKNSAQFFLELMLLLVVVRFSLGRVFYKIIN